MPHGLDHVVHAVRDLDAATAFYSKAGFQVGTRNRHPWGTHNRIVQLPNAYIELLEVAEPEKITPHRARLFSFGAFNRDFLSKGEGLSMLILRSTDARADAEQFEAAGIGGFEVFDFSREGERADGSRIQLAFSLAFAKDRTSPQTGFAACQHHHPENFWDRALQGHSNGALSVSGFVLVADNPTDHHVFLRGFTGLQDLHSNSLGVRATTENGAIEIVDAVSFRDRFGFAPAVIGDTMSLNAARIAVENIDNTRLRLQRGGIVYSERHQCLIVSPDSGFGASLIFEEAKEVDLPGRPRHGRTAGE